MRHRPGTLRIPRGGQPRSITDGLSGVVQNITYTSTGGGIGQPATVSEQNGTDFYSAAYAYGPAGDRLTSSYSTPAGTVNWGYTNYVSIGFPSNVSRVFETMNRLNGSFQPTGEAFD